MASLLRRRRSPPADYPLVICKIHAGDPLPGYALCEHAAHGGSGKLRERPSATQLGVIACDTCQARRNLGPGAALCCVHCALEQFGVPL